MILAELEAFHSRPVAPTRRVALGRVHLPLEPAPGLGGLLLGAVVAANMGGLEPRLFDDLDRLALQVQQGQRVAQPRLRHRLQTDRVGLLRSSHTLESDGDELRFNLDERGTPTQHVLAAVYAATRVPAQARAGVVGAIRKAMRWPGGVDRRLIAHLAQTGPRAGHAWSVATYRDPAGWALEVFGLAGVEPSAPGRDRRAIQRRFRELLRQAHPDHGGAVEEAARRIAELNEARRILLAY